MMLMRLSRDQVLMKTAYVFSERSTCSRAHVGAVASREGRILVTGYNGAPAGMDHCNHDCTCEVRVLDVGWKKPTDGVHHPSCSSLRGCTVSVHAEANCVSFAARHGVALHEAELHTTHAPCLACAQLIVNAGIVRVVYQVEYRITSGIELLYEAGVDVARL